MKPELLHILQHSLGVDKYGQHPKGHVPRDEGDGCGPYYRNHYVAEPAHKECRELCAMGYMTGRALAIAGEGNITFRVTPEGMKAMREHSPKPPKISKARQRYLDWLDADGIWPEFGDYLKWLSSPEGKEFKLRHNLA